jgi:hypothetical protein
VKLFLVIAFLILLFSCKHKLDKKLIIGSWITTTVYDSVSSIHTFDENGNYLIDDSSNGRRYRRFTNRYRITKDDKYLIPTLSGGGEPNLELTKLTNEELELTIGTHTRKYQRYKD